MLFRVALVLLKIALADKLSECQTFYETLERLRRIPLELLDEDVIINEVICHKQNRCTGSILIYKKKK